MSEKNCFFEADIMLPKENFEKWSVIACDQYTSEPEYWQDVKDIVGDTPSALNIILPECYLSADNTPRINSINRNMKTYLESGVFAEYKDSFVYVERTQSDGVVRRGIVGKIDLEAYDYRPGTDKAVRATEQTVISRIPPRVEIRKDAPLEMPHVMLLIDDSDKQIIESLTAKKDNFQKLYDFTLMKNAGDIKGYKLDADTANDVKTQLSALADKNDGLLFCVGDGNHSLATAKECYELNKSEESRYALVEIVNIHDDALQFEPIYRVVFGIDGEKLIEDFITSRGGEYTGDDAHKYTCIMGDCEKEISVKPSAKLEVGTLQSFLDEYLKNFPDAEIDYIHGTDSTRKLCQKENTVGFIFSGMEKGDLFPAVSADGSLPRKTFSMGHADDKRFYLEARKIK